VLFYPAAGDNRFPQNPTIIIAVIIIIIIIIIIIVTPWPQSASELCRSSDRRTSAKLVPILADRRGVALSERLIPMAVISVL
jgi:hypothetical protein